MGTLHCALENGADLYVHEHQKIRHYYRARSTEEGRNNYAKSRIFTLRGAYVNCAIIVEPNFVERTALGSLKRRQSYSR